MCRSVLKRSDLDEPLSVAAAEALSSPRKVKFSNGCYWAATLSNRVDVEGLESQTKGINFTSMCEEESEPTGEQDKLRVHELVKHTLHREVATIKAESFLWR